MEERYYTRQNLISAFLVGALIGLGGYYLFDNTDVLSTVRNVAVPTEERVLDKEKNTETTEKDDFSAPSGSISIVNQTAGLRVFVESVSMRENGWIAVHESINGNLGSILGARRLNAGVYENQTVELLRNTLEGNTYYAVMHTDDGDKEFDQKKDIPVLDERGNMTKTSFRVVNVR